jgi:hypothetical protein
MTLALEDDPCFVTLELEYFYIHPPISGEFGKI